MTSGAWGPMLALLALMASISSPEPPSGFSSLILMPYFEANVCDGLAVVRPIMRTGDEGKLAFLLRRGHQIIEVGGGLGQKRRLRGFLRARGPDAMATIPARKRRLSSETRIFLIYAPFERR